MKKVIGLVYAFMMLIGASSLVASDISAYLTGSYINAKSAEAKLKEAGFEVIANYESVKNGSTIVFTNSALKAEASKKGRGHAAVMRLFVDDKEKKISFTNPVYFGRAFMQDDYNDKVFSGVKKSITDTFADLMPSIDRLEDDDLSGYHFMMGMPYYEDPDELAEGSQSDLISKAKSYKKGKNLVFELKLSDKSTLLGYELGKKTKKFVKKIGRANAAVLPYCILIEDGKATSLAAKYYLAVSYPLLTMGEFMTISTVPGAIEKDLKKPFK